MEYTSRKKFFLEALKNFASKEQLFYKLNNEYYAYIPKGFNSTLTLQSRNSLIGQFTEKWVQKLLSNIAESVGMYALNGVICEELGLSNKSGADLAFCTTNTLIQKPENIKLLFEIKMSILSNYKYSNEDLQLIGDYSTHKGIPSLLRSDSMLKAIGKAINIRVSKEGAKIPIIVIGNSPITQHYVLKVDFLKTSGVIQGFISINSIPTDKNFIFQSPKLGFNTIGSLESLTTTILDYIKLEKTYFSSMITNESLAKIIDVSSKETSVNAKAEKFLQLIKD